MSADLLVEGASAVVTMDARRAILAGAAIAVRGGRIAAVGPAAEVKRAHPGLATHDASGCVVTPGFVNAHQHLTGDRLARASIPDALPAQRAIAQWALPLHAAHDPADDELSAVLASVEALRNGITTVIEAGTVAHPERVAAGVGATGLRVGLGTWGWDRGDGPHVAPAAAVLERLEAVLVRFRPGDRVEGWVSLVGHDRVSDELYVGAAELARRYATQMTFHMSSSRHDTDHYLETVGVRPLVHLGRLGVLGPRVLVAHALRLGDDELEVLLRTRTAVVSCPWAYLRLGQGFTRVGRQLDLLAADGRLAVGCDSENAGDQIDVLRAVALFAGLAADSSLQPGVVGAQRAFELATIRGAEAVGQAHDRGSIEPGKLADLVIFDPTHPTWMPPGDDLYLQLVWGTDGRSVRDVLVGGEVVVRAGRSARIDERDLGELARRRGAALRARRRAAAASC